MKAKRRGMVHVYTGDGKGKTTAALGLALRVIGHGGKVFMLQFMKGSKNYGEIKAAEKYLPDLTIVQSGQESFVSKEEPAEIDIRLALEGLALAKKVVAENYYDLVILDEINVALDFKLVPLKDVLELIKNKPEEMELVLTGRYAPREIIEMGDVVSNVTLVNHPYYHGVEARQGIEF
ncbi:MAG TPA: cob(I)yrinic acid a,c-diamide adenosyltransferase [Bacillota bacterium]|nr:cob(I)yrinic acid a,c-diamide adenosyltransferase [Peptococcaceae bacterium MAG4]NLW38017.1 cob(I)yrinic acid a,c-diamide adenosyltransferase [Peptococcaceae bacterium]HPZ42414.1 cob(I)yrinic acid a,c-diamide adenosyltransferase [Bacillota bacterium]HQD75080.1 cob(I)yrinic acid a,c-diamide adenosyltransferase [Bacillota bacterium]HUM57637.1 cob(I)yrinic acid a,c-diamide adenosyltransferase [Bacillota bacterium]